MSGDLDRPTLAYPEGSQEQRGQIGFYSAARGMDQAKAHLVRAAGTALVWLSVGFSIFLMARGCSGE